MSICDVDLAHIAHISDDEDHRFQLPVAVYGEELGRHSGGRAHHWGPRELLLRRALRLRLVNVGPASRVDDGALGYPLCAVCGRSRSPFSTEAELKNFREMNLQRCQHEPQSVGFFADVTADALSLPECVSRDEAFSVLEALRIGASQVLEMEREDLDVLVIGKTDRDAVDGYLYDPMPGGSGLLDQLCARFSEVVAAALVVVEGCPSRCDRACIDCLLTFRNAHFHRHLDRHAAGRALREWGKILAFAHKIPPREEEPAPPPSASPTNHAESLLRELLLRAGFPEARWQQPIELGKPDGVTTPDAFFPCDDPYQRGVCVYLDGLGAGSHGDPAARARDHRLREKLRSLDYEVLEIAASELSDREVVARHFYRLANLILDRSRARAIREDVARWFDAPQPAHDDRGASWERVIQYVTPELVPLVEALRRANVSVPDETETELTDDSQRSYRAAMVWRRARATVAVVQDSPGEGYAPTCVPYGPERPLDEVVDAVKRLLGG